MALLEHAEGPRLNVCRLDIIRFYCEFCSIWSINSSSSDLASNCERGFWQSCSTRNAWQTLLTSDVLPEKREAWFTQKLREGVQGTISDPKIIETGINYVEYEQPGEWATVLRSEMSFVGFPRRRPTAGPKSATKHQATARYLSQVYTARTAVPYSPSRPH